MTSVSYTERFLTFWFRPMDPLPLRIFETILCACMCYYFTGFLQQPEYWLTHEGYHVSQSATLSSYIPPPPLLDSHQGIELFANIPFLHVFISYLSLVITGFYFVCGLYILGIGRKWLNWVMFAIAVYVQAMDQPSAFTINRMFIISFFVLALQPPVVEIDGKKVVSGWIIRFFQLTLIVQYTTAGICKMYAGNWLEHSSILWGHSQGHYKTVIAAYALHHLPMFMWSVLSFLSLAFEFFAFVLFTNRRTRMWVVIFGIAFHLSIAVLMKELIYFSLQMITAYIFFIEVSWLQRCANWLTRRGQPKAMLTKNKSS